MAKRQKQKTRGSQYIAEAALTDLVEAHLDTDTMLDPEAQGIIAQEIAKAVIKAAWDVEHFPVAGKVTITLDLAALDKPTEAAVDEGCHYISNGVQCALLVGHDGPHDVG